MTAHLLHHTHFISRGFFRLEIRIAKGKIITPQRRFVFQIIQTHIQVFQLGLLVKNAVVHVKHGLICNRKPNTQARAELVIHAIASQIRRIQRGIATQWHAFIGEHIGTRIQIIVPNSRVDNQPIVFHLVLHVKRGQNRLF